MRIIELAESEEDRQNELSVIHEVCGVYGWQFQKLNYKDRVDFYLYGKRKSDPKMLAEVKCRLVDNRGQKTSFDTFASNGWIISASKVAIGLEFSRMFQIPFCAFFKFGDGSIYFYEFEHGKQYQPDFKGNPKMGDQNPELVVKLFIGHLKLFDKEITE